MLPGKSTDLRFAPIILPLSLRALRRLYCGLYILIFVFGFLSLAATYRPCRFRTILSSAGEDGVIRLWKPSLAGVWRTAGFFTAQNHDDEFAADGADEDALMDSD